MDKVTKTSTNEVEKDLVDGLGGFLRDLQNDEDIRGKYTCHRMTLDLKPVPYSAEDVKATRSLLQVSQKLFAQFIGVSVSMVSAWEQGARKPQDIACRFLDEIQRNPDYYRQRLAESMKPKTCAT